MKSLKIAVLSLFLALSSASANAAIIEFQFNSLTFTDGHQVTGIFNYDTIKQGVESLAISLFGNDYNIDFDIDDLDTKDGFSVSFDNNIFGDSADEGFQLNKNGFNLLTGIYGYGVEDTCFFDNNGNSRCTGTLFRMTSNSPITATVDAPHSVSLLLFGFTLLLLRNYRS